MTSAANSSTYHDPLLLPVLLFTLTTLVVAVPLTIVRCRRMLRQRQKNDHALEEVNVSTLVQSIQADTHQELKQELRSLQTLQKDVRRQLQHLQRAVHLLKEHQRPGLVKED